MGLDINFYKQQLSDIGYFRKVNFLVKFFENMGYKLENCIPIEIIKEDVEELLDRCNKVLENHELAKELLPSVSGFFFGSVEYDELYFDDVERVKYYIETELLPEFEDLSENECVLFEINY